MQIKKIPFPTFSKEWFTKEEDYGLWSYVIGDYEWTVLVYKDMLEITGDRIAGIEENETYSYSMQIPYSTASLTDDELRVLEVGYLDAIKFLQERFEEEIASRHSIYFDKCTICGVQS